MVHLFSMHIEPVDEITNEIRALAVVARGEGHGNVDTLVNEFVSGANRFEHPGEGLFGAFEDGVMWFR